MQIDFVTDHQPDNELLVRLNEALPLGRQGWATGFHEAHVALMAQARLRLPRQQTPTAFKTLPAKWRAGVRAPLPCVQRHQRHGAVALGQGDCSRNCRVPLLELKLALW